jgi:hypothetical protein
MAAVVLAETLDNFQLLGFHNTFSQLTLLHENDYWTSGKTEE